MARVRAEWTEEQAKQDLAVLHYPGKWAQARQMGHDRRYFTGPYEGFSYWERVRYLYLELGGLYVGQLEFTQTLRYYAKPPETAYRA